MADSARPTSVNAEIETWGKVMCWIHLSFANCLTPSYSQYSTKSPIQKDSNVDFALVESEDESSVTSKPGLASSAVDLHCWLRSLLLRLRPWGVCVVIVVSFGRSVRRLKVSLSVWSK